MVEENSIPDVKVKSAAKKPKTKKSEAAPVVKAAAKPKVGRDIGLNVPVPAQTCDDENCPFHGKLPVRGRMIDGVIVSAKMTNTVVVEKEYLRKVEKYERYEKRTSRYPAHCPPCIGAKVGDKVKIGECRPLSKTVSFVVISKEA
jgi:small subunit ribosomal protein S17